MRDANGGPPERAQATDSAPQGEVDDWLDVEEIERVLADPDEEWTPLEEVLAESERLP